jgi:RND family efflux transporter MFP subunit
MSQLVKVSTVPTLRLAAGLVTCVLMTASGDKPGSAVGAGSTKTAATEATASGPAISVTTVIAGQRDVPVELEATGTVVPVTSVEVRPQVTSAIISVHVREGQFVRTGDLLFTLDSRADEANVARLRAQMAKDDAALADARRQLTRSRDLLDQKFISQGAVDTNQSLVDSQAALVAADRAAIDSARVALAYGRVTAPSAGRVGAVVVYPGTSVQANQTTLVTITQLDPIDVSFNVPQRNLGDVLAALKEGGATVTAALPESQSTVSGKLLFVDNAVDAASGTVKVKARFDNADSKLWPGAFVKATLNVRTLKAAVVVPQAAIIQNAKGTIVYVVEDGKAVQRPVQILAVENDDAAVTGVKVGEKVVLDGRQNLRPGAPVMERAREGTGQPRQPTPTGPAGPGKASTNVGSS